MSDRELTGKVRFRTLRKWGSSKLVLQVEETRYTLCHYPSDTSEPYGFWRDATPDDLINNPDLLKELGKNA